MSTNSLAIATTLGVNPSTIIRLQEAGVNDVNDQQRFVEIARFVGQQPDALLPYVERGISLQTLSAASQATRDSGIGEDAPFSDLVELAHSVGEMSRERILPEGYTIHKGQLVSVAKSAELDLQELQTAATAAGFTTNTSQEAESALPGSEGNPTSEPAVVTVNEEEKAPEAQGLGYESETGQEKILNGLLETAEIALDGKVNPDEIVNTLNRFITMDYQGDALLAHIASGKNEHEFINNLRIFAGVKHRDLLLPEEEYSVPELHTESLESARDEELDDDEDTD